MKENKRKSTQLLFGFAGAAALTAGAAVLAKRNEELKRETEEKKFSPPGEMVDVDGKRMHVLITDPPETAAKPSPVIVMLPGYGTSGPSLDFLPLARKLAEKGFRCVSPEPFGYGFSDDTDKPRTADLMIDEIRVALCKLQIPTPFILLGHSIAGFYIRIWADRYPEEICGLVGVDNSVPEQMEAMKNELKLYKILHVIDSVMQKASPFGLDRIFIENSSVLKRSAHNDPDILPLLRYAARKSKYSKAVVDESTHFAEAAEQTAACPLPACPFLIFVATGKGSASQVKFKCGFSWLQAHHDLANSLTNGKAVELPGMHYLHWDYAERMAEEIASMFL